MQPHENVKSLDSVAVKEMPTDLTARRNAKTTVDVS